MKITKSAIVNLLFVLLLTFTPFAVSAQQSEPKPYGGTEADAQIPEDGKLRIICFGAHPDDAEIRAGGSAALWSKQGHHVALVSTTNGDIGHWQMSGGALAKRRFEEVQKASKILGSTSKVWDIHDGELEPNLENRRNFTREIRRWNADIVIAHRPNDYHPDHRYTGVLMQDSAYMVGVPFLCPDVPPLKKTPVFLYSFDSFQKPNPFTIDIAVAIDDVIEQKIDALMEIESQFIEGGATGFRDPRSGSDDPKVRDEIRNEMREHFKRRAAFVADKSREKLIELYGEEKGKQVKYAEAFEICEYGRRPSIEEIRQLFQISE
ncbi:MAG: PIG-L deacetylase family protein [Thermoguttaceae bacterium]